MICFLYIFTSSQAQPSAPFEFAYFLKSDYFNKSNPLFTPSPKPFNSSIFNGRDKKRAQDKTSVDYYGWTVPVVQCIFDILNSNATWIQEIFLHKEINPSWKTPEFIRPGITMNNSRIGFLSIQIYLEHLFNQS